MGATLYQTLPSLDQDTFYAKRIGTSFITPYFAAQIAAMMQKGVYGRKEIWERIKAQARYTYKDTALQKKGVLFSIEKAAIMPFNKEMHSLIKFEEMLPFEITEVYDSKYMGNVGEKHLRLCHTITGKTM